jgi:hypothetical protein
MFQKTRFEQNRHSSEMAARRFQRQAVFLEQNFGLIYGSGCLLHFIHFILLPISIWYVTNQHVPRLQVTHHGMLPLHTQTPHKLHRLFPPRSAWEEFQADNLALVVRKN